MLSTSTATLAQKGQSFAYLATKIPRVTDFDASDHLIGVSTALSASLKASILALIPCYLGEKRGFFFGFEYLTVTQMLLIFIVCQYKIEKD